MAYSDQCLLINGAERLNNVFLLTAKRASGFPDDISFLIICWIQCCLI